MLLRNFHLVSNFSAYKSLVYLETTTPLHQSDVEGSSIGKRNMAHPVRVNKYRWIQKGGNHYMAFPQTKDIIFTLSVKTPDVNLGMAWTPDHKKQKLFSFYRSAFLQLQSDSELKSLFSSTSHCHSLAGGCALCTFSLSQSFRLVFGELLLYNTPAKNMNTNTPNLQVGRLNNLLKDTHSVHSRKRQGV